MSEEPQNKTPELSLVIRPRDIGDKNGKQSLETSDEQRAALAHRFDLPSIEKLTADYQLQAGDDGISLRGMIEAALHQSCATSGEPFPVTVMEPFDILFVAAGTMPGDEEEVELAAEDCDIVEYLDGKIDIGEAIAQSFYLALDPYARSPDAEKIGKERGLKTEDEAGPFGVLASLRDKLRD